MEEYQDDADRTDVANGEEVHAIEAEVQLIIVGELVVYYLSGNIPAHKQAGQHASQGQHEVGCQLVTEVHERQSHDLYIDGAY